MTIVPYATTTASDREIGKISISLLPDRELAVVVDSFGITFRFNYTALPNVDTEYAIRAVVYAAKDMLIGILLGQLEELRQERGCRGTH